MSPRGDPESAELRAKSTSSVGDSDPDDSSSASEVLPLRLSVARGGLGVELARPLAIGPLLCEELDLGLLGVSYPVDLSKGVKQFKTRRSELRGATVVVDLPDLSVRWAQLIAGMWGERAVVRLTVGSAAHASLAVANRNNDVECICVCVHSVTGVLAFDLVLASGNDPRLIVDCARAVGTLPFLVQRSATQAALQVLDVGLAAGGDAVELSRQGRSVVMAGLARAVCLGLMPQLGFRMPHIERNVIVGVEGGSGQVRLKLSQLSEPFAAGFRALHLSSAAEFTRKADDLLAQGKTQEARQEYLRALESAPSHGSVLLDVADLDLSSGERTESALSFLEEKPLTQREASVEMTRRCLLSSKVMERTGRIDSSAELLREAVELETDPIVFAHLVCRLAESAPSAKSTRALLDRGVAKAPMIERVRLQRLRLCLAQGDGQTALADAEALEAGLVEYSERVKMLLRLAELFAEGGREDEAIRFLRRALRIEPDNHVVMLLLAHHLLRASEVLRAAELYSAALRKLESLSDSGSVEERARNTELSHSCHFFLAEVLNRDAPERPEILLHLGAIPSRSSFGARARLWEVEFFQARGSIKERDRALGRFIEAAQLGWFDPVLVADQARRVVAGFSPTVEPEVAKLVHSLTQDFAGSVDQEAR